MIPGGRGRFDPDNATPVDRFTFRMIGGSIAAGFIGVAIFGLVEGLRGRPDQFAISGVAVIVLAVCIRFWRRIDRRMTRAIDARRTGTHADSGQERKNTG